MAYISQRSNILHTSQFYFNGDTGVTEATKQSFLSSDVVHSLSVYVTALHQVCSVWRIKWEDTTDYKIRMM
jgi:hypothetical protein